VRSALARGYPTIVPSDGHTTSNRLLSTKPSPCGRGTGVLNVAL
jgi:hypothetical protein